MTTMLQQMARRQAGPGALASARYVAGTSSCNRTRHAVTSRRTWPRNRRTVGASAFAEGADRTRTPEPDQASEAAAGAASKPKPRQIEDATQQRSDASSASPTGTEMAKPSGTVSPMPSGTTAHGFVPGTPVFLAGGSARDCDCRDSSCLVAFGAKCLSSRVTYDGDEMHPRK